MLTHIVLMSFDDQNDTAEAVTRLASMAGRIPGLVDVTVGADTTDGPFHLGLVTTFTDGDALDAYQSHPVHIEHVTWLRERIRDRAVVDMITSG